MATMPSATILGTFGSGPASPTPPLSDGGNTRSHEDRPLPDGDVRLRRGHPENACSYCGRTGLENGLANHSSGAIALVIQ